MTRNSLAILRQYDRAVQFRTAGSISHLKWAAGSHGTRPDTVHLCCEDETLVFVDVSRFDVFLSQLIIELMGYYCDAEHFFTFLITDSRWRPRAPGDGNWTYVINRAPVRVISHRVVGGRSRPNGT